MMAMGSTTRKILRRLFISAGVTALLIVAAVLTAFVPPAAAFMSHRADIAKLIETADPADKSLPPPVHDLLLISFGGDTVPGAARRLLYQFDKDATTREGKWFPAYLSWCYLIDWDLTEQERETVIATVSLGSRQFSLNGSSIKMFGRPLSQLSVEQAATLIAGMGYFPPEQRDRCRAKLLVRYRQQHPPTKP